MESGSMLHEESFRISTSQQELLNSVPFVGDTLTSPCNCNCNCNRNHPAEDPPLPSSVIHVSQCEFNQAVIDVEKDSELGFLEQDRLSEFPEIHPDDFSVLDRAISDFDKAPVKKLKLGFDPLEKNDVMEIAEMRNGPVLDLLPDSIRSEEEEDKEKQTFTVFDVLKVLAIAKTTTIKEDDGLTLLETAKLSGVIFPRPTWWPEDMKSELFKL